MPRSKKVYNLLRHVGNVKNVYKLPCVVAVNRFPTDTDGEIDFIIEKCKRLGVNVVLSDVWAEGGKGGEALAKEIVRLCDEEKGDFTFAYTDEMTICEKIEAVTKKIYGRRGCLYASGSKADRKSHVARVWKSSRMHRENAIQFFGRSRSHGCAFGF